MMTNHEHLKGVEYPDEYYLTEDLSNKAIDFVKPQLKEDRPFFLYLAHYAPIHAPKERIQK